MSEAKAAGAGTTAPARGACLCGSVQFIIETPALFSIHCHCTMCQRGHGAAYVTWIGVPNERLSFEAGESLLTHYASSEDGVRSFCSRCGSTLFCRNARHPELTDVALANVSGHIDPPPSRHIYFSDRTEWVAVADALPKLGGSSGFEPV